MTTPPVMQLADMPLPWRITHPGRRRESAARLGSDPAAVDAALVALDRILQSLADVAEPPTDQIPESLLPYWDFTAEWLAESMPEFGDIAAATVERLLEGKGISGQDKAEALARYFSWWLLRDTAESLLYWLGEALENEGALPAHRRRLLETASRRWRGVDTGTARHLIRTAVVAGQADALPLLDTIDRDPAANKAVKEAARNYRKWIPGVS